MFTTPSVSVANNVEEEAYADNTIKVTPGMGRGGYLVRGQVAQVRGRMVRARGSNLSAVGRGNGLSSTSRDPNAGKCSTCHIEPRVIGFRFCYGCAQQKLRMNNENNTRPPERDRNKETIEDLQKAALSSLTEEERKILMDLLPEIVQGDGKEMLEIIHGYKMSSNPKNKSRKLEEMCSRLIHLLYGYKVPAILITGTQWITPLALKPKLDEVALEIAKTHPNQVNYLNNGIRMLTRVLQEVPDVKRTNDNTESEICKKMDAAFIKIQKKRNKTEEEISSQDDEYSEDNVDEIMEENDSEDDSAHISHIQKDVNGISSLSSNNRSGYEKSQGMNIVKNTSQLPSTSAQMGVRKHLRVHYPTVSSRGPAEGLGTINDEELMRRSSTPKLAKNFGTEQEHQNSSGTLLPKPISTPILEYQTDPSSGEQLATVVVPLAGVDEGVPVSGGHIIGGTMQSSVALDVGGMISSMDGPKLNLRSDVSRYFSSTTKTPLNQDYTGSSILTPILSPSNPIIHPKSSPHSIFSFDKPNIPEVLSTGSSEHFSPESQKSCLKRPLDHNDKNPIEVKRSVLKQVTVSDMNARLIDTKRKNTASICKVPSSAKGGGVIVSDKMIVNGMSEGGKKKMPKEIEEMIAPKMNAVESDEMIANQILEGRKKIVLNDNEEMIVSKNIERSEIDEVVVNKMTEGVPKENEEIIKPKKIEDMESEGVPKATEEIKMPEVDKKVAQEDEKSVVHMEEDTIMGVGTKNLADVITNGRRSRESGRAGVEPRANNVGVCQPDDVIDEGCLPMSGKVFKADSLNELYNMDDSTERRVWLDHLFEYMEKRNTPIMQCPVISRKILDLFRLYQLTKEKGGFLECVKNKSWKEIASQMSIDPSPATTYIIRKHYGKHLLPFECQFDRGGVDPDELLAKMSKKQKSVVATQVISGPVKLELQAGEGDNVDPMWKVASADKRKKEDNDEETEGEDQVELNQQSNRPKRTLEFNFTLANQNQGQGGGRGRGGRGGRGRGESRGRGGRGGGERQDRPSRQERSETAETGEESTPSQPKGCGEGRENCEDWPPRMINVKQARARTRGTRVKTEENSTNAAQFTFGGESYEEIYDKFTN